MNSASARVEALGDAADRRRHGGLVVRIALQRDDLAAAVPGDGLLEGRLDHGAVGIVGNEGGEGMLARGGGVLDDAVDVRFRQETQQIDAAGGDIGVGREGDDRDIARTRHLADEADRLRKQRAENDLGALVERLLSGEPRGFGGAAVVFHQELDIGIVEFRNRHLGGIAHRLAGDAGIARRRQRQDQAGLDLAGADGRARRRLRALRRRRRRQVLGISGAPGQQRAGGGQQAGHRAAPCRHGSAGVVSNRPPPPEPALARTRRFSPRHPKYRSQLWQRQSDILAANG